MSYKDISSELSTWSSERNINLIQGIQIEDLNFLEKDLDFNEKVSLLFLLYGTNRDHARYALQRLYIGLQDTECPTNYLTDWVHTVKNDNWRYILVEALLILDANCVLKKLGLNLTELFVRFLPKNLHISIYVHPMLKCLYHVCEQLLPEQALQMVFAIDSTNNCVTKPLDNGNFLEISMLRWLSDGIIDVDCNVQPIIIFLKEINKIHLKDILLRLESVKHSAPNTMLDCKLDSSESVKNIDVKCPQSNASCTLLKFEIRQTNPGVALIINQRYFNYNAQTRKQFKTRTGTDMDKEKLRETFASFGYHVICRDNLAETGILEEVESAVNLCINQDSLFICLLSHGDKDFIYDSNCVPVQLDKIKNKIISPKLLGKPKIMVIQACRGGTLQTAREITSKLEYDCPEDYVQRISENESIPVYSDVCIAYSTVPGFQSIRDTDNGSWFIQTFCECLDKFGDKEHFLDILTFICDRIANLKGENNECMMPKHECNFRRKFYLPPRK